LIDDDTERRDTIDIPFWRTSAALGTNCLQGRALPVEVGG
jgi:hypothetical protein